MRSKKVRLLKGLTYFSLKIQFYKILEAEIPSLSKQAPTGHGTDLYSSKYHHCGLAYLLASACTDHHLQHALITTFSML